MAASEHNRFGIGFDIHRLNPSEPSTIPLGGVPIPAPFKVEAHSDGDTLLHAIVDAILGALAMGDIGQRFPDSAPENKNRPSTAFALDVVSAIEKKGWQVFQIDSIIFLEKPKLFPVVSEIRTNLAKLFHLEYNNVSVKAKTMEKLGPIGSSKAVAAQAMVQLTMHR